VNRRVKVKLKAPGEMTKRLAWSRRKSVPNFRACLPEFLDRLPVMMFEFCLPSCVFEECPMP